MTRLNTRGDGYHAWSDPAEVQQWEAVQWLIEYVKNNNEMWDSTWAGWNSADHIISTYRPSLDGNGSVTDPEDPDPDNKTTPLEIGDRGRDILDACIAGEDAEILMNEWQGEIQKAGEPPHP